ncbi:hypothetical protein JZ751_004780 [Albula glossodonta]|uniref:DM10 domain-containing protein n=1 Tax=Albula glossodonta TaxID=121402 RepID=A0A8T2P1E6_9TELE|nr:hypothetical protein JZ751_004780 [Albula glossodonta]
MTDDLCHGLPFLPGNTFRDITKLAHHRPQTLTYKNGYIVPKRPSVGIGQASLISDQRILSEINELTVPTVARTHEQYPASPRTVFVPGHVAFDKKTECPLSSHFPTTSSSPLVSPVLRFFGYFQQEVQQSPQEQYRVRPVIISYYLEDDSFCMIEPEVMNSGIPQGKLLKRQRLPKGKQGDFYHWKDLNVGIDISVFGVTYRLTSCDRFTQEFLLSEGILLNEPEEIPLDPYTERRNKPQRAYVTPSDFDSLRQFLTMDRKVLRFYALWEHADTIHTETRPVVVQFYLADDSLEIRETHEHNSGRDPYPVLLHRQKLFTQTPHPDSPPCSVPIPPLPTKLTQILSYTQPPPDSTPCLLTLPLSQAPHPVCSPCPSARLHALSAHPAPQPGSTPCLLTLPLSQTPRPVCSPCPSARLHTLSAHPAPSARLQALSAHPAPQSDSTPCLLTLHLSQTPHPVCSPCPQPGSKPCLLTLPLSQTPHPVCSPCTLSQAPHPVCSPCPSARLQALSAHPAPQSDSTPCLLTLPLTRLHTLSAHPAPQSDSTPCLLTLPLSQTPHPVCSPCTSARLHTLSAHPAPQPGSKPCLLTLPLSQTPPPVCSPCPSARLHTLSAHPAPQPDSKPCLLTLPLSQTPHPVCSPCPSARLHTLSAHPAPQPGSTPCLLTLPLSQTPHPVCSPCTSARLHTLSAHPAPQPGSKPCLLTLPLSQTPHPPGSTPCLLTLPLSQTPHPVCSPCPSARIHTLLTLHPAPQSDSTPYPFPSCVLEVSPKEVQEYYSPRDFIVGEPVSIMGREFLLYGCDEFTRNFYQQNLSDITLRPLQIQPRQGPDFKREKPHNFLGGVEPGRSLLVVVMAVGLQVERMASLIRSDLHHPGFPSFSNCREVIRVMTWELFSWRGRKSSEIRLSKKRKPISKDRREIPPYNGFGSPEDTVQNCISLIPEPPKKDLLKMLEKDGKVLRYTAKLDSVNPDDSGRRFIVSYFLSNDMMSIFETNMRNSGIIGGKFLEKTRVHKPGSTPENPQYYSPADFAIGSTVEVFKWRFVLIDADLFVLKYLETIADEIPAQTLDSLRKCLGQEPTKAQTTGKSCLGTIPALPAPQTTLRKAVEAQCEERDLEPGCAPPAQPRSLSPAALPQPSRAP